MGGAIVCKSYLLFHILRINLQVSLLETSVFFDPKHVLKRPRLAVLSLFAEAGACNLHCIRLQSPLPAAAHHQKSLKLLHLSLPPGLLFPGLLVLGTQRMHP